MHRNVLQYLLIVLIAGQSLTAMADLRSFDQFGETDSELGYQLALLDIIDASSAKNANAQNSDFTIVDCFDCGYCYCCCYPSFFTVRVNTLFDSSGQLITGCELSMTEITHSPFLRPPKI